MKTSISAIIALLLVVNLTFTLPVENLQVCAVAYLYCTGCYSDVCGECQAGFYLEGGQCFGCPLNCDTCTTAGCTLCMNGYTYDPHTASCTTTAVAIVCSTVNCASCTADLCTACDSGYFLDAGSQCALCADKVLNCLTCNINPNAVDNVICAYCQNGYMLNADTRLC